MFQTAFRPFGSRNPGDLHTACSRDQNRFRGNFLDDEKEFKNENWMGGMGRIWAIEHEFVRGQSVVSLSSY
jgi:hypothetical protein